MTTKPQQLDADYMTVKETAVYLKVHPKTVIRMVEEGKLDGKKLGAGKNSSIRISSASIEKLLKK
jgi:excisionase family DNA binding protein